jgi:hypothetical protein
MANTNIAGLQGGDTLRVGDKTPYVTDHDYEDLRVALTANGSPNHIGFFDDFLGGTLRDEWQTDIEGSGTIAVNAGLGGTVRITTDATTADRATLALGLHHKPSLGGIWATARIASVTALTTRTIEFGISDAVSETAGLAFSSHDATPVDVATNGAVFGYNAGESMTAWSALAVNAGTPVYADTGATLTAGTYQVLSLHVNSAGDVRYYVDGVLVATHLLGVLATGTYTLWCSVVTGADEAKVVDLDYAGIISAR